jgi:hypothetical protein
VTVAVSSSYDPAAVRENFFADEIALSLFARQRCEVLGASGKAVQTVRCARNARRRSDSAEYSLRPPYLAEDLNTPLGLARAHLPTGLSNSRR